MKQKVAILFFILIIVQSCYVPHKSFVATSYEPLTVKKKGDMEITSSIRPFKFFKSNITYATSDRIAIRVGFSGFFGLYNFDAGILYFKNYTKNGLYLGGNYNFQSNVIGRSYSIEFLGIGRGYKYNCQYHSPSVIMGFRFREKRQFILKTSYNIVSKYYYSITEDNATGKNTAYLINDSEVLDYKIPNFFSFEPSYVRFSHFNKKCLYKFQIGLVICQNVYNHHYSFNSKGYNTGPKIDATKYHPVYFPINISFGLIFKHSKKEVIKE